MAKAVISSTYDNRYLYFLPIVTWCWNKLGVDVICFMPRFIHFEDTEEALRVYKRLELAKDVSGSSLRVEYFDAPEHKEATYSQCSRLYAACLDIPEDELLITSDIDMALFKIPVPEYTKGTFTVFGSDLVPENQFPICYLSATVRQWRDAFNLNGKSYQQCLDELLGNIECESFRGNYWGKDQEEAYNKINLSQAISYVPRSNGQNQWATKRYDRDDSYILDRLSPDTIDYHMNRPGFEDGNFQIILTIMKYHFPNEDFKWLIDFNEQYKKLL